MWLNSKTGKSGTKRTLLRRHTPVVEPVDKITAADFKDGTFLDHFARSCVFKGVRTLGRPALSSALTMAVGSGCTGSAMDLIALESLQRAFGQDSIPIGFSYPFFVECDKAKAKFCANVHDCYSVEGQALPTRLADISTFAVDAPKHGVPVSLQGFIAGFSCKDFSKCNVHRKDAAGGGGILAAASSPGKSADTFAGVLQVLDTCPPDWGILENVDDLVNDLNKPSLDKVLYELSVRGYDHKVYVINCSDYALPQRKLRIYIVFVRVPNRVFDFSSGGVSAFFGRLEGCLRSFKIGGPSLTDVLMADSHPKVMKHLHSRQEKEPKGWESGSIDIHRGVWEKLGIGWQVIRVKREEDRQSPWLATLGAREKDSLAYHQHVNTPRTGRPSKEQLAKMSCYDVNQSITQRSFGSLAEDNRVLCCTVLPKAKVYLSIDDDDTGIRIHRLLHGSEALQLNGWPVNNERLRDLVDSHNPKFLADLAGNSFASTVIVAIVAATLFSAKYLKEAAVEANLDVAADSDGDGDDDVDDDDGPSALEGARLLLKRSRR
jgi:site-specific DNA-cytosine methylase